jgi:hypothetical protein
MQFQHVSKSMQPLLAERPEVNFGTLLFSTSLFI